MNEERHWILDHPAKSLNVKNQKYPTHWIKNWIQGKNPALALSMLLATEILRLEALSARRKQ
jgi:hypothetical protein